MTSFIIPQEMDPDCCGNGCYFKTHSTSGYWLVEYQNEGSYGYKGRTPPQEKGLRIFILTSYQNFEEHLCLGINNICAIFSSPYIIILLFL